MSDKTILVLKKLLEDLGQHGAAQHLTSRQSHQDVPAGHTNSDFFSDGSRVASYLAQNNGDYFGESSFETIFRGSLFHNMISNDEMRLFFKCLWDRQKIESALERGHIQMDLILRMLEEYRLSLTDLATIQGVNEIGSARVAEVLRTHFDELYERVISSSLTSANAICTRSSLLRFAQFFYRVSKFCTDESIAKMWFSGFVSEIRSSVPLLLDGMGDDGLLENALHMVQTPLGDEDERGLSLQTKQMRSEPLSVCVSPCQTFVIIIAAKPQLSQLISTVVAYSLITYEPRFSLDLSNSESASSERGVPHLFEPSNSFSFVSFSPINAQLLLVAAGPFSNEQGTIRSKACIYHADFTSCRGVLSPNYIHRPHSEGSNTLDIDGASWLVDPTFVQNAGDENSSDKLCVGSWGLLQCVSSSRYEIKRWMPLSGTVLQVIVLPYTVRDIAFCSENNSIVVIDSHNDVSLFCVWNYRNTNYIEIATSERIERKKESTERRSLWRQQSVFPPSTAPRLSHNSFWINWDSKRFGSRRFNFRPRALRSKRTREAMSHEHHNVFGTTTPALDSLNEDNPHRVGSHHTDCVPTAVSVEGVGTGFSSFLKSSVQVTWEKPEWTAKSDKSKKSRQSRWQRGKNVLCSLFGVAENTTQSIGEIDDTHKKPLSELISCNPKEDLAVFNPSIRLVISLSVLFNNRQDFVHALLHETKQLCVPKRGRREENDDDDDGDVEADAGEEIGQRHRAKLLAIFAASSIEQWSLLSVSKEPGRYLAVTAALRSSRTHISEMRTLPTQFIRGYYAVFVFDMKTVQLQSFIPLCDLFPWPSPQSLLPGGLLMRDEGDDIDSVGLFPKEEIFILPVSIVSHADRTLVVTGQLNDTVCIHNALSGCLIRQISPTQGRGEGGDGDLPALVACPPTNTSDIITSKIHHRVADIEKTQALKYTSEKTLNRLTYFSTCIVSPPSFDGQSTELIPTVARSFAFRILLPSSPEFLKVSEAVLTPSLREATQISSNPFGITNTLSTLFDGGKLFVFAGFERHKTIAFTIPM